MADNPEEWRRLRSEFIEAAAKYEEYETFIERTAHGEDRYYNNGRYFPVGLIRWPYKPWRKCWILAPHSGTNEEPFSTMQTLFSKVWLWLPRVIAEEVLDTAEMHLSPPADTALFWANSHYQYWCWLLWFDGLRQWREVETEEAEKPSEKMVLPPFSCSADLIARWGLDGSAGNIPVWLALPTAPDHESQPAAVETSEAMAKVAATQESTNRSQAISEDGNAAEGDDDEATKPPSKDDRRAEWIGKALMLRKANPNMSKAEIARQVGVHPGQLSPKRFPELAELEKMLRGDVTGGHLTKDSETGLSDVEATSPTGDKPDRGNQITGSKLFREYCAECGEPMRVTREQIGTHPRCEDCAE